MADEYRKPASPKPPPAARGTPVRRADDPPDPTRAPIATGADPRKKAHFAAEAAAATAELETARRTSGTTSRIIGLGLLAMAVAVVLWEHDGFFEAGMSPRSRPEALVGLGFSLGPWLIAFGSGGVAHPRDAPKWYRWGAGACAVLGVVLAHPLIAALLAITS